MYHSRRDWTDAKVGEQTRYAHHTSFSALELVAVLSLELLLHDGAHNQVLCMIMGWRLMIADDSSHQQAPLDESERSLVVVWRASGHSLRHMALPP